MRDTVELSMDESYPICRARGLVACYRIWNRAKSQRCRFGRLSAIAVDRARIGATNALMMPINDVARSRTEAGDRKHELSA